MKCNWQQTSPDQIEIQANPRPILMLFGLPFLGIGLWMIWNFFGALKDVVTHQVTLMDNILGLTLLPVLGALILWPGVLMVLTRKKWVVNAAAGRAEETTSVLFKSWSKSHPLDGFKAVRAYQGKADSRTLSETIEDQQTNNDRVVEQPYCVDFVFKEGKTKSRTVGVTKDAAGAIAMGQALARLSKLPFVNDTAKDGEDYDEEGSRYKVQAV
jgi:hypothetical protein